MLLWGRPIKVYLRVWVITRGIPLAPVYLRQYMYVSSCVCEQMYTCTCRGCPGPRVRPDMRILCMWSFIQNPIIHHHYKSASLCTPNCGTFNHFPQSRLTNTAANALTFSNIHTFVCKISPAWYNRWHWYPSEGERRSATSLRRCGSGTIITILASPFPWHFHHPLLLY